MILKLYITLFAFGVLLQQAANGAEVETYHYEAVPAGNPAEKQSVEMTFGADAGGVTCVSRTVSKRGLTEIRARTDAAGEAIAATRQFRDPDGVLSEDIAITRNGAEALLNNKAKNRSKFYDLPAGKPLAVDATLLILMRLYPFDQGITQRVYMIDFSGSSVFVTLRQTAREKVTVPAGTFDCFRMEVVVQIPIFKPKIVYWISQEPPHFMVKSIGKQGPFTPVYEISLIEIEKL